MTADRVDQERLAGAARQDEANERLWTVFAHSPEGICLVELDGRIETANPAFCLMLGRSVAELQGTALRALALPGDAALLETRLRTTTAEGPAAGDRLELRFVHQGGAVVWGATRIHLVRGAAGQPLSYVLHVEDVTEERHAQELLHENEEKFRIAFENAPTGMSIVRADGQYLSVNEALCQMLGYSREELLTGTLHRITHPEDIEKSNRWIRRMIAGDLSEPECEKRFVHRDGHVVWGVVRARWLREPDGAPRFAVVHVQDVTERKRGEEERAQLEAQLHRAQKMEAIGLLAGGVAHDFNNLLTAVGANASLALDDPDLPEPLRPLLGEISQAVTSASNLTRQLLAFSRKEVIAPRVIDVNDVVAHLRPLLARLLGEGLRLEARLDPALAPSRFDPGQLEQILINLSVNARDAMRGGGLLTVRTANVETDADWAARHPGAAPGPYVLLAVSDDGCGMDAETRARLFEPFFTTKEKGKGTGLGLATVYGAVKQNGGVIEVSSAPQRGTTFEIFLPRVDVPAERRAAPSDAAVIGGSETVVLVEDDAGVRGPALRMLERLGYTVHAFRSGAETLASIGGLEGRVDLVVTDVVMPGMDGRQLADRLTALHPGLPVLFTSGYAEEVVSHHGILDPGIDYLPKPYSLESLARRVRAALDAAPRRPR